MKRNLLNLLYSCVMILSITVSAQAQIDRKVAVFDPVGTVEKALLEIVREEISSAVVNTQGYTVLERQLINKVLEENKFQESGLVNDEQVSDLGKLIGADFVFVTSISTLGNNYYISCKMIEVATARIDKQSTGTTTKGMNDVPQTTQSIVKRMFGENEQRQDAKMLNNQTIKSKQTTAPQRSVASDSDQSKFHFGVRTGLNFTSFYENYNVGVSIEANRKLIPGFQIGVVGELAVMKSLAIQPGFLLATQGCGSQYTSGNEVINVTSRIYYIQVPVNVQYKLDVGGMRLLLQAGPYFGYAVSGKDKWEYKWDGGNEKDEDSMEFGTEEDQVNPLDFGLGFGVGLGFGKMQFGLGYNVGLKDLNNYEERTLKNRGLAITATYLFGK